LYTECIYINVIDRRVGNPIWNVWHLNRCEKFVRDRKKLVLIDVFMWISLLLSINRLVSFHHTPTLFYCRFGPNSITVDGPGFNFKTVFFTICLLVPSLMQHKTNDPRSAWQWTRLSRRRAWSLSTRTAGTRRSCWRTSDTRSTCISAVSGTRAVTPWSATTGKWAARTAWT